MIEHMALEAAAAGGPLVRFQYGDRIIIDIPSRSINLDLTHDQLSDRLSDSAARRATTNPASMRMRGNSAEGDVKGCVAPRSHLDHSHLYD